MKEIKPEQVLGMSEEERIVSKFVTKILSVV